MTMGIVFEIFTDNYFIISLEFYNIFFIFIFSLTVFLSFPFNFLKIYYFYFVEIEFHGLYQASLTCIS